MPERRIDFSLRQQTLGDLRRDLVDDLDHVANSGDPFGQEPTEAELQLHEQYWDE